jgi:hypothetical protein
MFYAMRAKIWPSVLCFIGLALPFVLLLYFVLPRPRPFAGMNNYYPVFLGTCVTVLVVAVNIVAAYWSDAIGKQVPDAPSAEGVPDPGDGVTRVDKKLSKWLWGDE